MLEHNKKFLIVKRGRSERHFPQVMRYMQFNACAGLDIIIFYYHLN